MRDRQGMTLIEMILSVGMAGVLLASIFTSFVTGQRAFQMSEAMLQSQQAARNVINAVQSDLSGSQLYSYRVNAVGKTYIKFRQVSAADISPADGLADMTDAQGQVRWQEAVAGQPLSQMRMYLWCTPATLTQNPCSRLNPPLTLPATPTGATPVGPLMLVTADPVVNPNGKINVSLGWIPDRVLAQNISQFDMVLWALDPISGNPTVLVRQSGDPSCTAPAPGANPGEQCVNRRAHATPEWAFDAAQDILPAVMDLTLQTTSRTSIGQEVQTMVRSRVHLRNAQD